MTRAFVGLGANVGNAANTLRQALEELGALPGTRVAARSPLYRSAPIGFADQPDFLNAVAEVRTSLSALELLAALMDLESRHGRERPFPNAPRTLDLDLLLFGDEVLASDRLTLPHPRMHERAFVLRPLLDLDPDLSIPGVGPARAQLAHCSNQRIERIA